MNVTIEFNFSIDGELDEKRAAEIFFEHIGKVVHGVITDENIDDKEGDWAIILESWELK